MSKMILPGDQTGLYHLIVAGLPWQCSWEKLKDFVRNISDPALNVDYVEVHPGSTDGWVRFSNKEDFNIALGTPCHGYERKSSKANFPKEYCRVRCSTAGH